MSNSLDSLLADIERSRRRRFDRTIDAVEADDEIDLDTLADRARREPDIGWLLEVIDEDEDGVGR